MEQVEKLKGKLDVAEQEYQEAVGYKQALQQEFADMNVLVNGRRANEMEYNAWRQRKLKEMRNVETLIARRKQARRDAHETWFRAKVAADRDKRVDTDHGLLARKDQEIASLKHENMLLTQRNNDLEMRIRSLDRQVDILIRQHNDSQRNTRETAGIH